MITLSYSGTNKYIESPRAYYLHYLLRLRPRVYSSAFIVGDILDQCFNEMLLNKDGDPVAVGLAKFDQLINAPYKIHIGVVDLKSKTPDIGWFPSDDDRSVWDKRAMEMFADKAASAQWISWNIKGRAMIEAYAIQVLPHIRNVVAVQKEVGIATPGGDKIRGFLDFQAIYVQDKAAINYNPLLDKYNGKHILFDNKTASRPYLPNSVKESEQLGTYAHCDGINTDAQGYIVIPKKFRKTKEPLIPIQIIIDNVAEPVVESIFKKYDTALKGIKLGNFDCNENNCKNAKFGCPYVKYCKTLSTEGLVICDSSEKR